MFAPLYHYSVFIPYIAAVLFLIKMQRAKILTILRVILRELTSFTDSKVFNGLNQNVNFGGFEDCFQVLLQQSKEYPWKSKEKHPISLTLVQCHRCFIMWTQRKKLFPKVPVHERPATLFLKCKQDTEGIEKHQKAAENLIKGAVFHPSAT